MRRLYVGEWTGAMYLWFYKTNVEYDKCHARLRLAAVSCGIRDSISKWGHRPEQLSLYAPTRFSAPRQLPFTVTHHAALCSISFSFPSALLPRAAAAPGLDAHVCASLPVLYTSVSFRAGLLSATTPCLHPALAAAGFPILPAPAAAPRSSPRLAS